MTDTFGLDLVKPVSGKFPEGPKAYIYVKRSGTYRSDQSEHELIYITPDCVVVEEIDEQINGLIKELKNIQTKAHKKFLQCKPH